MLPEPTGNRQFGAGTIPARFQQMVSNADAAFDYSKLCAIPGMWRNIMINCQIIKLLG